MTSEYDSNQIFISHGTKHSIANELHCMLSWCMKDKQQNNATEGEGGGGNRSIDPDHVSTFSEGRPMKQHNEIPAALLEVTMCLPNVHHNRNPSSRSQPDRLT